MFSLGGKGGLVGIDFEVAGDVQLSRALSLLIDKAHDLRGAWVDIQADFIQGQKAQFSSQGRAGSGGWAALSPRYAAWKSRRYPGRKILERTGKLKKSLTDKNAEGHVFVSSRTAMSIGTAVRSRSGFPYPVAHQKGGRHLPKRPPIELTARQKKTWPKIIQKFIWDAAQPYFRRVL